MPPPANLLPWKRIPHQPFPGQWMTGDGRFLVRRYLDITTMRQLTRWEISTVETRWTPEREILKRHGLADRRFSTRREALQRLQDALQLEEPGDE